MWYLVISENNIWYLYLVKKKVFVTLCNESSYISDTNTSSKSSDSSDSGDFESEVTERIL